MAFPGANDRIVFASGQDGGLPNLYSMNTDGTEVTRRTSSATSDLGPAGGLVPPSFE